MNVSTDRSMPPCLAESVALEASWRYKESKGVSSTRESVPTMARKDSSDLLLLSQNEAECTTADFSCLKVSPQKPSTTFKFKGKKPKIKSRTLYLKVILRAKGMAHWYSTCLESPNEIVSASPIGDLGQLKCWNQNLKYEEWHILLPPGWTKHKNILDRDDEGQQTPQTVTTAIPESGQSIDSGPDRYLLPPRKPFKPAGQENS